MSPGLDTAALVALLRAAKRPPVEYANLVEETGDATTILTDEHGLLAPALLEQAKAEISAWSSDGISVFGLLDPGYPPNLRAAHDRPPLLFVAGQLKPDDARSVAVIGTRRPSAGGIAATREVASQLIDSGFTVVSGLAAGIDTAAHTSALERGGRTVAVIGTGIRHSYPPQNAALQQRIASTGAVVSQFWPDDPPHRRNFPLRNAVTSGIALATIVIEASHTSGARIQARLALGHGRPVLLMARLLDQQWARQLAARPGTRVIRSTDEVVPTVERLTATRALSG
jgi:DNA processing protein